MSQDSGHSNRPGLHAVSDTSEVAGGLHATQVDLSGVLQVLSQHLYSTPVVAIRELVQNAHDSIVRRRLGGEPTHIGSISVETARAPAQIHIHDDGAGLTEREIHSFLATVGAGATRQAREAAELGESADTDQLIGLFGLGFLSAFVIADLVTVTTTSMQSPNETWVYQSRDGAGYSVRRAAGPTRPIGTTVTVRLNAEHHELAGEGLLRRALRNYCALLSVPIRMGADAEPINSAAPPWRSSERGPLADKARLEFARQFDQQFAPLCTMDVQGVGSDVTGLLWVQDGGSYASSDNRQLSVFVRGMLLDDNHRDLLPRWAGFIGGVIESSVLTPTASREDLQRDEHWHLAREAISESLIEGLAQVAATNPAAWRRVLLRHDQALLGAALSDQRLFELIADAVRVPTSHGDLKMTEIRSRGHGRLHVSLGGAGGPAGATTSGFEEMVSRALGIPVARGDRFAVVPFMRRYAETRLVRLVEMGTEAGNTELFTAAKLDSELQEMLHEGLCGDSQALVPSRFAPSTLPLVVVPDRAVELKERIESDEADEKISTMALRLARLHTEKIDAAVRSRVYLNLDCAAVQAMLEAHAEGRELEAPLRLLRGFKRLLESLADQADPAGLAAGLEDFCFSVQHLALTSGAGGEP